MDFIIESFPDEQVIDLASNDNDQPSTNSDSNNTPLIMLSESSFLHFSSLHYIPHQRTPWRPSTKLIKVIKLLHTDHYLQFPCLPCVFCGRLLYPEKAKWTPYDPTFTYPIKLNYPDYQIQLHSQLPERVSCCPSCISSHKRLHFPQLAPIPDAIVNVPYHK
jgi:hypothetical protein